MVIAACGGGDADDPSFDGTTVRSDDGVLTVQVPTGAAADGVEVSIRLIEEGDLPAGLRDADQDAVTIVGYELGPDGAEFSEPVTVTFRLDPSEYGLDLPEGAVPPALLLTENAAGELERIECAQVSRADEQLVVRGRVAHFSPVSVVVSAIIVVELQPEAVSIDMGQTAELKVVTMNLDTGARLVFEDTVLREADEAEWTVVAPFSITSSKSLDAAITCSAPTEGKLEDAYSVVVPPTESDSPGLDPDDILGQQLAASPRLAGDGTCVGAAETVHRSPHLLRHPAPVVHRERPQVPRRPSPRRAEGVPGTAATTSVSPAPRATRLSMRTTVTGRTHRWTSARPPWTSSHGMGDGRRSAGPTQAHGDICRSIRGSRYHHHECDRLGRRHERLHRAGDTRERRGELWGPRAARQSAARRVARG